MQTTNRCPKCGSTKYVKRGKVKIDKGINVKNVGTILRFSN
jgi:predicted nucleic-acid-binding Zn-ribbon protein